MQILKKQRPRYPDLHNQISRSSHLDLDPVLCRLPGLLQPPEQRRQVAAAAGDVAPREAQAHQLDDGLDGEERAVVEVAAVMI